MSDNENKRKQRRKVKKQCFLDAVEKEINNVEIIINHIDKTFAREDIIDMKYIEQDLEESYFDLEISLGLLAVLLRKMSENSYIELPQSVRDDINALIHSAKFVYDEDSRFIRVYSRKGEEQIQLSHFLDFAGKIIS